MDFSTRELALCLRNIRESLGYSIYDVNKLCDISPSYLSLMENGKRRPSPIILKKLSSIYNVDYNDLLKKAGFSDLVEDEKSEELKKIGAIPLKDLNTMRLPVLGTVKAGYDYLIQENIIGYVDVNLTFKKEDDNYYALKIKGESMEPILSEGDTVIVHKQDFFESGKFCIVLINGEEATVKKVYKLEDGIELIALNPAYPSKKYTKKDMDKIPVKVIGVVKQLIKKLD